MKHQEAQPRDARPLLRDIGESGAIALMAEILGRDLLAPDWVGVGDDCAVTSLAPGMRALTTSDLLVEGTHFRRSTIAPADLGWKALIASVSDIHSMGGAPAWAIVGVSLPGDTPVTWLGGLYRGLAEAARTYRVPVVGGDTVGSPGPITLAVTVVGQAARPRLRSHARPGDVLIGTGPVGLSRAGLWALEHPEERLEPAVRRAAELAHTRPVLPGVPAELVALPRFAMLDDSDGLGTSCRLIAEASGVAVRLAADRIPRHAAVGAIAAAAGEDPLAWRLWGGEDYGLVAAIPPDAPVPAGWTVLGEVASGAGAWLVTPGGDDLPLEGEAYRHFAG